MGKPDRSHVRSLVHYDEQATDKVFEAVEYLQTTGERRGEKQQVFNWRTRDGISKTVTVHSDGTIHVKDSS